MGKVLELTGQRFGRLTAIRREGTSNDGKALWTCRCECGSLVTTKSTLLKSGRTRSCGCLQRETVVAINKACKTTHLSTKSRLYSEWRGMRRRCSENNTEKCKYYADRGITVCDEWRNSFVAFRDWALANGYRDDLTIDRIDNDGNYCPENCRWTTVAEQNRNRSCTRIITHDGQTRTLAEWSKITGIAYDKLRKRIAYGWSVERALTTK